MNYQGLGITSLRAILPTECMSWRETFGSVRSRYSDEKFNAFGGKFNLISQWLTRKRSGVLSARREKLRVKLGLMH